MLYIPLESVAVSLLHPIVSIAMSDGIFIKLDLYSLLGIIQTIEAKPSSSLLKVIKK